MQFTAAQIAALLDGTIEGDPEVLINRPGKIEEGGTGALSFLANPKYESYIYETTASAVLVSQQFEAKKAIPCTLIRVKNVQAAMTELMHRFGEQMAASRTASGLSARAVIDESATIGEGVVVGALTVIESNVRIGADSRIHPQVYIGPDVQIGKACIIHTGARIMADTIIGDNCVIQPNAVVGAEGFGFALQEDATYRKIPQLGNVILEESVEIGANATVDRAVMGSTVIGKGSKIDNLVMIAHNVRIGEHTVMAAQSGVAGSTQIGDHCQIGGQAGIVGHIQLANGTRIQAQSGINKSLQEEGAAWYGSPALPYNDYLRSYAVFRRLPQLKQQVSDLRKQ